MTGPNKRIAFICQSCGSSDITSDAIAEWNGERQQWIVVGHYDAATCQRCDTDTRLIEVELDISVQKL